jgi:transcriptional regulator with XRE-family HTH domain
MRALSEQFAANLCLARRAAGHSQEDLGVRAELHRTEISQLERGLRVPRIDTLAKLSGALGVEPAFLMDGIRWSPAAILGGGFKVVPVPAKAEE